MNIFEDQVSIGDQEDIECQITTEDQDKAYVGDQRDIEHQRDTL